MRINKKYKNSILPDFDKLQARKCELEDCLTNIQREKDYKLTKIETEYSTKLEDANRELNSLKLQLKNATDYVKKIEQTEGYVVKGGVK